MDFSSNCCFLLIIILNKVIYPHWYSIPLLAWKLKQFYFTIKDNQHNRTKIFPQLISRLKEKVFIITIHHSFMKEAFLSSNFPFVFKGNLHSGANLMCKNFSLHPGFFYFISSFSLPYESKSKRGRPSFISFLLD